MYLEYDAIVPTSQNPGANHTKLRDFRVVLFGVYFSSSIPAYPFYFCHPTKYLQMNIMSLKDFKWNIFMPLDWGVG